jgi:O-antigen/teichoic acid export membrane protein
MALVKRLIASSPIVKEVKIDVLQAGNSLTLNLKTNELLTQQVNDATSIQNTDISGNGERQQLVKNSVVYLAASTISQLVGVVRSVIVAVLFTPAQLGTWNLMSIILGYGTNAHLGILHSMNKTIPFLRGQSRIEQLETVKNSVFWVNLALGGIVAIALACWAFLANPEYKVALVITAATIFLLTIFTYQFSILRADNRFMLTSKGVSALGVLSTLLVVVLGFGFRDPLIGALTGLMIAYASIVFYWFWKGKYHFAFRVHVRTIWDLFLAGLPLITICIGETILLSVDRWFVATKLGGTMLGHYAICIMASSMIALVPSSLASVLYTKMLERQGAIGNPVALCGLFAGPMRAMAALMSVLIGSSVLLLPFLVRLRILLVAAFFYSISFISGNLLLSINKQKLLLIMQVILIPLAIILDTIVIHKGWGIVGIAGSTAVIYVCFGCTYLFFAAYYVIEKRKHLVRFIIDIFSVFTVMLMGLAISLLVIPEGATFTIALFFLALRFVLFGFVVFPVLWLLNRNGEIVGILRESANNLLAKLKISF